MICYRDMTFCTYKKCSKFKECDRALTKGVQNRADEWWNGCKGKAPICVFAEHPDCYSISLSDCDLPAIKTKDMPHKRLHYLQDGTEFESERMCGGTVFWDIGLEGWCCDVCDMTTSIK